MKFLPEHLVRPHMIPINLIYKKPNFQSEDENDRVDVLTIVYKDQDSGEKIVYTLKEPKIEIYIVKPEKRTYSHMRDMIEMKDCDKFTVKYRSRWADAAKILKLDSGEQAKASPYVFNADIAVETYYLIQFIMEYQTDRPKTLSLGKLDIENDLIRFNGEFPGYGEPPINAVTYVNMETNDVYTLVLLKDDLPDTREDDPRHEYFEYLRKHFYEQVDQIKANENMVLDACHEKFDELYPGMKYNILYFDDESELMKALMYIIHQTDNEYIGIWNSPYDMQHIEQRPAHLGLDPLKLIPDDRFSIKMVSFREDTNPSFHKRRHECITSTIPSFLDDMVLYSGIRSGYGVLPSHKLGYIAQKELKDTKYDYSEVSDIIHLFYDDLLRFILYNIKDVLLLVGLERKTNDMSTIYSRMYQMFVFPREAFTTTKVVWHSLIKFMYDAGYVPGTNRNRGKTKKHIIDWAEMIATQTNMSELDSIDDMEFDIEEDEPDENEKEEKYEGAFVANTLHMQPTGVKILGADAKYIHDYVADSDVGSESLAA